MNVPTDSCAAIETLVFLRNHKFREEWTNEDEDGRVEDEGKDDFMEMQRKRTERNGISEGFDRIDQQLWWWDGERVSHGRGRGRCSDDNCGGGGGGQVNVA
nr:hypothetical protein CFP56_52751 [Quercus suber]